MSHVIPSAAVRYILDAPAGEARVAANRIAGSDPDGAALVIIANTPAYCGLLDLMICAIKHAPDEDTKAAWKGLALRFGDAIQGEMRS